MFIQPIRTLASVAALAVVLGPLSAAFAQAPSAADKEFVRNMIQTNNAEIATAHLALQHSSSNDVKQFAMRMIKDHSKLNTQMKPLAAKMDVEVPNGEVDAKQQALAEQLKPLTGNAFDQQYIAAMVEGHARALKKIQTEIASTQDPQIKQAAQQAEPIIQHHLQLAQKMASDHHVALPPQ